MVNFEKYSLIQYEINEDSSINYDKIINIYKFNNYLEISKALGHQSHDVAYRISKHKTIKYLNFEIQINTKDISQLRNERASYMRVYRNKKKTLKNNLQSI